MNWLLNRLKEKTTWIGLATFLSIIGYKIEPAWIEPIATALSAVVSVILIVTKEKTNEPSRVTENVTPGRTTDDEQLQ